MTTAPLKVGYREVCTKHNFHVVQIVPMQNRVRNDRPRTQNKGLKGIKFKDRSVSLETPAEREKRIQNMLLVLESPTPQPLPDTGTLDRH